MIWLIVFGVIAFIGLILYLFRKNWGAFFRFLVSKLFLINLVLALSVAILVPYCSIQSLDDYTNHGIKKEVPYLVGISVADLDDKMSGTELNYKIIDSTFSDKYPKGAVLKQDPDPKLNYDSVKPGRTIYLTIVKQAGEYKEVPDLTGNTVVSKEVAKIKLESRGFKVIFKTKQAKNNNVIALLDKNKNKIQGGAKLLKGSTITVVHGSGKGGAPVNLPNVNGKTVLQANHMISQAGLVMEVNYEPAALNQADSSNFVITKQNPSPNSVAQGIVQSGTTVTVIAEKSMPAAVTDSIPSP